MVDVVVVVVVNVVVVVVVAVVVVVIVVLVVHTQASHSTGQDSRNAAATTLLVDDPTHMCRRSALHVLGSGNPLHSPSVVVVAVVDDDLHWRHSTGHLWRRTAASVGDTAVASSHCAVSEPEQSRGSSMPLQYGVVEELVNELVDVVVVRVVVVEEVEGVVVHASHKTGHAGRKTAPMRPKHMSFLSEVHNELSCLPLHLPFSVVVVLVVVVVHCRHRTGHILRIAAAIVLLPAVASSH